MNSITLLSDPRTTEFKTHLQEFRLMPTNLDPVVMGPNLSVHTSDGIKRLVIKWMYKHPTTKSIAPKLEELINNNVIVIGYMDKSKLGFLYRRFKRWLVDKPYTLGFYNNEVNKIVVILDDNVSMFGKSIVQIPNILIHELMHMIARNDIKLFLKYTNEILVDFYSAFFLHYVVYLHKYFYPNKIKDYQKYVGVSRKYINKLIRDISYMSVDKSKTMKEILTNVSQLWKIAFNSDIYALYPYIPTELKENLDYFLMAYWIERNQKKSILDKDIGKFITTAFIMAYKNIDLDIIREHPTNAYQEIIDPDEVICMYSEKSFTTDTNLQTMINKFES